MKYLLIILITLCFQFSNAQPDSLFIKEKKVKYVGPQWKQENKGTVDINQVSFTNWNSGGSTSISGLLGLVSSLNYTDKFFNWKNNVNIRYGINKQEARETRKTDDLFEVNSNLGYNPNDGISNWFYSARLNFRTQLTNGFNYPNKKDPISRLLAPGYLFFGGGMEYGKNIDKLSFYFSPITLKATFVLDEDLANAGSFGVTPAVLDSEGNIIVPGDKVRKEVGVLVTNSYEMEIIENINVKNQVSLYSDYVNNFGNVDVDWRIDFDFKVNSFVRATLGSHIRYDDDVKTQVPTEIEGEFDEAGAKVQWKQFLGVGFAVDF
ncbi:DUF3078 domain-containing protein [Algibacter amylolyticus]|uniref:DUF3078 domain-containing protein n=1 Tax=Algibacter amylolyticus TaxID=1608400 RepID=A0A5M7B1F2_9FLAO|nr:DUF3078 domain-containing protein [Algibacter amylolyticus]KAA5823372.1 DUF3078 domain-containing protein [Algibacter amylolyticus]MBB5267518.1 hypothetical protein [Algibacter amylolyticus]TSJ73860.1 DUF3078 domain-containing protein [Algibacter amylolyticus]